MKETKTGNYRILLDPDNSAIILKGTIRFWDPKEYLKLKDTLLNLYREHNQALMKLDLSQLQYLNSSSINMICKFIFDLKDNCPGGIEIIGNDKMTWQKRSFMNFRKLWNKVNISFK